MTERPPKLLSVGEAAETLGVSQSWLNKSRLSGDGPAYLKVGNRCLYSPDDLTAYLGLHRRTSTSEIVTRAAR